MHKQPTQYSAKFKAQIVQEMLREEKTISQIAAEHGIHPNQLGRWKAIVLAEMPSLFERRDQTAALVASSGGPCFPHAPTASRQAPADRGYTAQWR